MCDSQALNHLVHNVNFLRPSPPPCARRLRPERLWLAQRCTAGRRRSLGPHRPISRLFLHQGREHRRCSVNPIEQRDALSLSFSTSLCSPELTALLSSHLPRPLGSLPHFTAQCTYRFSPINPSAHLEHRGPWGTKRVLDNAGGCGTRAGRQCEPHP